MVFIDCSVFEFFGANIIENNEYLMIFFVFVEIFIKYLQFHMKSYN